MAEPRTEGATSGVNYLQTAVVSSPNSSEATKNGTAAQIHVYSLTHEAGGNSQQTENMDLLDLILENDSILTQHNTLEGAAVARINMQGIPLPTTSLRVQGAIPALFSQGSEHSDAFSQATVNSFSDTTPCDLSEGNLSSPAGSTIASPSSTNLNSPLSSTTLSPNVICQEPNMSDSTRSDISDTLEDLDDIAVTDLLNLIGHGSMDCVESNGNLNSVQLDPLSLGVCVAPQNQTTNSPAAIHSTQGNESLAQLMPYSTQGNIPPVLGNQDLLSSTSSCGKLNCKHRKMEYLEGQHVLIQYLKKSAELLHIQQNREIPWTLNNSENEMEMLCSKVKDLMLTHYPCTMALKDLDVVCQQRKCHKQVCPSSIPYHI